MNQYWQCRDCKSYVVISTSHRGPVLCEYCGSSNVGASDGTPIKKDTYAKIMQDAMALHERKAHDYAADNDKYSNFTRAAEIVSWFKEPIDQVFACLIAIKLARTAELRNGKSPNNESIRDTDVDRVNYEALWGAYHDSLSSVKSEEPLFGFVGATIPGKTYSVNE